MEKKMNARLLSLNILTHELFGRNYRLFGDQTAEDYTFEKRMHRFLALIDYAKPDVIMLQELSGPKYWGTVLDLEATDETKAVYESKHFPGYVWINKNNRYGVPYADNQTKRNPFDAHNMIMYSKEKFELIDYNTFFLTKDGTRNASWYDNTAPRIQIYDDIGDCTWIALRDKASGVKAIYATTHSYVGSIQRNAYHVEQLQIMTDTLGRAAEKLGGDQPLPIVVAGDFNISPKRRNVGHSYEHMVKYAKYDDAKLAAPNVDDSGTARVYGNDMGGHDGTTAHGERIDFFFSQGMDIDRYNVLNGMFRPIDDVKYEYVHEDAKFDGSMYDLSDHQPIYCEVTIGEGGKYASHREDTASFYKNPITAEDDVIPNTIDESPVIGSKLKFERCRILPFIGGGYNNPTEVALVEDKEKGRILRFISAKNASSFAGIIEYAGIFGRYGAEMPESEREKILNAKKLKVTFKTEMSIEGVHLDFFVLNSGTDGLGQYKLTKLPTDVNGEWRTLEVDVSSLSGPIAKIGIYGRSHQTGLLRGDAVYIESVDFE